MAQFYDAIFARVFFPRVSRGIRALHIGTSARVLELGVGTGLSLEAYPRDCQITGIDYSRAMLAQARKKAEARNLSHIELLQMDAQALSLRSNEYDFVMAFHIVTVVPEPERLMREAMRVCRPGGLITIINHFREESGLLPKLEQRVDATLRRLGWTTMTEPELLDPHGLEILSSTKDTPHSLFTTIVARNPG